MPRPHLVRLHRRPAGGYARPDPNPKTGFVIGAVVQSVLSIADLVRPQVLYFWGCFGAAAWNALIAAPVNFP